MTPNNIEKAQKAKASEITFLRITVGALLVVVAMEGMVISTSTGIERTIITPPTIEKSFWVSADGVSKSYLEQMAYWYAGLALSVTKTTGEYQKKLFLEYASPDKRGQLAIEMANRLSFNEKNSASTMFTPYAINVDNKLMRVALFGELETFVQDKRTSLKRVVYVVGFKNANGKLYIHELKETNEADIFGTGTPQ